MKKIILILTLIIFAGNAFALSGKRRMIEREVCYTEAVKSGESKSFAKAYCKCVADQLDRKYTDKQLDKLVSKGYDQMTNKIRPLAKKCYNKTKQTSANQGSKIINCPLGFNTLYCSNNPLFISSKFLSI